MSGCGGGGGSTNNIVQFRLISPRLRSLHRPRLLQVRDSHFFDDAFESDEDGNRVPN
jgi:hypothetical protein